MKNKILFLDHDGVICLPDNFGSRWLSGRDGVFDDFDQKSVKVLNSIIQETDCEIVVSSDWKIYSEIDYMRLHYEKFNILKGPIDYTEELFEHSIEDSQNVYIDKRMREIQKYIVDHNVETWVVVDDLDLTRMKSLTVPDVKDKWEDNFVITKRRNEGIKQTGIMDKIIKILNEK